MKKQILPVERSAGPTTPTLTDVSEVATLLLEELKNQFDKAEQRALDELEDFGSVAVEHVETAEKVKKEFQRARVRRKLMSEVARKRMRKL